MEQSMTAEIILFPLQQGLAEQRKFAASPVSETNLFSREVSLFNQLVEENFNWIRENHPNLSDFEVLDLTEQLVAGEFYSHDYQ